MPINARSWSWMGSGLWGVRIQDGGPCGGSRCARGRSSRLGVRGHRPFLQGSWLCSVLRVAPNENVDTLDRTVAVLRCHAFSEGTALELMLCRCSASPLRPPSRWLDRSCGLHRLHNVAYCSSFVYLQLLGGIWLFVSNFVSCLVCVRVCSFVAGCMLVVSLYIKQGESLF